MSENVFRLNSNLFCDFAESNERLWTELSETQIEHEVYGLGQILKVLITANDFPRVTIQFDGLIKDKWSPNSFINGKSTFFVTKELHERVEEFRLSRELLIENKRQEVARKAKLTRAERSAESDAAFAEQHRTNLLRFNIVSTGVRRNSSGHPIRESQCWKPHRQSLSSDICLICNDCNWMICFCGACGCGRPAHFLANC